MSFCFFDIAELEYVFRFVLAAVCGSILGLERERRAKAAGIRTYTIVAISSALMMIVSKYGFFDVIAIDGASVDVSRVAAGVVSAIGFLGAGVIFVRNENTIGVTTAAGLWATVGVGITIGAGLYFTGIVFTFFLLMLQLLFHAKRIHHNMQTTGVVSVILDDTERTISSILESIRKEGLIVRNMYMKKNDEGKMVLTIRILFDKNFSLSDILAKLGSIGEISSCFFRVGHPTALILKGYHRALPFAGLLTCCVLFPQERSSFRTLQGASVSLLQGFYSLFLTTYYHRIASCQENF